MKNFKKYNTFVLKKCIENIRTDRFYFMHPDFDDAMIELKARLDRDEFFSFCDEHGFNPYDFYLGEGPHIDWHYEYGVKPSDFI